MKALKQTITTISLSLACLATGCGKDNQSAGDQAKAATDAVANKAGDVKDAITGKDETRGDLDARLSKEIANLKTKIGELEAQWKDETVPAIKDANNARLASLKSAWAKADQNIEDLRKSADAVWSEKKDATIKSYDEIKGKVASAVDREKFKQEVNQKLDKINARIETLKNDAAAANANAKDKIEKSRADLESQYADLKADYSKFKASADEKWDSFKEGFSKSFDELSAAFKGLFD